MSSKVKGLQYEANEPAFLQRMRAQNSGGDGRHERPIARPKKAKTDDDDDAPTYVMEDTHDTLSKKDYEELMAKGSDEQDDQNVTGETKAEGPYMSGALPTEKDDRPASTKVSEAKLGQKKRKAATVVRQDDQDDDEAEKPPKSKKTKKKAKPINLSFDDDDDDDQ